MEALTAQNQAKIAATLAVDGETPRENQAMNESNQHDEPEMADGKVPVVGVQEDPADQQL
ncbi:MAG: hypothetical protein ACYTF0_03935 [Planctomycetota bacterium]|jgi:hypothetical protein